MNPEMTPNPHPSHPLFAAMMAAVDSYSVPVYPANFDEPAARKPFARGQVKSWYKRDVKGGL